jgi:uncharacterized membrane protein
VPFDVLRWIVQYAHVFAGVLWFGGGFYTVIVQLPALLAVPAQHRGPALAELAPRQLRYIFRVAEVTIAFGILNAILTGRFANLPAAFGTLWGWAIAIGGLLAIGLYVMVRTALAPTIHRVLAAGRRVAQGDASAAADLPALAARIRTLGYVQMAVGAIIVLLMVTARFT